jgi:hypothetical protein
MPRRMNLIRAVSAEGFGRLKFYRKVKRLLDEDTGFRDYFEGETKVLPDFYMNILKNVLDKMWKWLPEGAINHDQNAYYKSEKEKDGEQVGEF